MFTFVSNQGSVVDVFLMSVDLVIKVNNSVYFEVGSRTESNHLPIHLSIEQIFTLNLTKIPRYPKVKAQLKSDGTLRRLMNLMMQSTVKNPKVA